MSQLAIEDLGFPEERTLDNLVSEGNEESHARLKALTTAGAEFRLVWLAGASGTGKTHVAEALCRAACVWPQGYFRWQHWREASREADFARLPFLAVDNVERLLGAKDREQWLMHLIDSRRRCRWPTLLTCVNGPAGVQCALRDLRTRLGLAEVLWLEPLADQVKLGVMTKFARARGFRLSEDVLKFVLTRHNRNLGRLIALLRRIDQHALAQKRRVTVPLVREILPMLDQAPDARET